MTDYIVELYDEQNCFIARARMGGLSWLYAHAIPHILESLGVAFTRDECSKVKYVKYASIGSDKRVDL